MSVELNLVRLLLSDHVVYCTEVKLLVDYYCGDSCSTQQRSGAAEAKSSEIPLEIDSTAACCCILGVPSRATEDVSKTILVEVSRP